ncbi:MAG: RHS repeat-associated core domain-containing protein, partial [Bacteroidota bacterium]
SADGTKLVEHYSGDSSATHDYVGGFFYIDDSLLYVAHEEGRALKLGSSFRYEYNLTDHLGNVRVSFSDLDTDGIIDTADNEVLQLDHYYPFGMRMGGLSYNSGTENRYRYNGKEYHQELNLGLYDYGARMYDPAIGRWNGVDELAENYQNFSPFNYVLGNPSNWIDPDGRSVKGNDTTEYQLDPVVITAYKTEKPKTSTVRSNFYTRLHIGRNSFGNSRGVATVDYTDVREFNNEASQLPYGVGFLYSLTIGTALDYSVGLGEIFDEGNLGSGGLKLASLIPVGGVGGSYLVKVGDKFVLKYSKHLWKVGKYNKLLALKSGLQAHHVGQKALMKQFIPGYSWRRAPSILVPALGHTQGTVVSRSTNQGIKNARQLLARDIFELRKIYPNIPNSQLQELIQLNKKMYPNAFIKK